MLIKESLLQTKELQEWAEDSEEFSQQTGQGVWQDNLRTCAETLFSSLLGVSFASAIVLHASILSSH